MNSVRDGHKDKLYYDQQIEERLKKAKGARAQGEASAKRKGEEWLIGSSLKFSGFVPLYMTLRFRYCRGDDLAELQTCYLAVIEMLEAADQALLEAGMRECLTIRIQNDHWIVLTLVAFGVGLKEADLLQRLAARVAPGDMLLDRVLGFVQPGRPQGEKLHKAKIYRGLLDVLEAPTEHQARLLLRYLNNWEKKLRLRDWWGDHELKVSGVYKSYLCFEAAAIAGVLKLDDSSFCDHEFYPKDLMHGAGLK